MHPVRVGTRGWSYREWTGPFYPSGLPANEQLPYLAQQFPVVAVDATFYRSPSRRMVEGWRDRTPPGFGFSLKEHLGINGCACAAQCAKLPPPSGGSRWP